MHIICLTPLAEGVYNDHMPNSHTAPSEGWAVILHEGDPIPKEWEGKEIDYSLPSTFPRLGSIEAKELTYTREVEVQKEVPDEDGNVRMEPVMEEREYTMMTVTEMTEGTLPEPEPEAEAAKTTEERLTELETSKANQTDVDELTEALELLLSGDTGEGEVDADDEA